MQENGGREKRMVDSILRRNIGGKGAGMEGTKWMDIRSDRQKGMSYTDISRKYHIDPRTAKRYAESS